MHAELKERLHPYRLLEVHTAEGSFNVQYQTRDPDSEYVSVEGKTVAHAQGGPPSRFTFEVGSLPATLEIHPAPFYHLATLTLTVDNQVIYTENRFELLLQGRWRAILLAGCWYLGVWSLVGLALMLVLLGCRWVLGSLLAFELDPWIPRAVAIAVVLLLWLATILQIARGSGRVSPDLLVRKVENPDEMRFERTQDEWEQFRARMVEGDEIWEWETPEWTWRTLTGRCGYVIVHQGHPTRHIFVTGVS